MSNKCRHFFPNDYLVKVVLDYCYNKIKCIYGFLYFKLFIVDIICFKVFMHVYFIFQKMSSLSPLTIILSRNKLTGENNIDWKWNLFIVLTVKNYKYILTQPCPSKPIEDSSRNQRRLYEKWQNATFYHWFLIFCRPNIRTWK